MLPPHLVGRRGGSQDCEVGRLVGRDCGVRWTPGPPSAVDAPGTVHALPAHLHMELAQAPCAGVQGGRDADPERLQEAGFLARLLADTLHTLLVWLGKGLYPTHVSCSLIQLATHSFILQN